MNPHRALNCPGRSRAARIRPEPSRRGSSEPMCGFHCRAPTFQSAIRTHTIQHPLPRTLSMLRFARAIAVASLACAPAALFAQSRFEGAITARMGKGQQTEVTFLVKGDQFRMDMAER